MKKHNFFLYEVFVMIQLAMSKKCMFCDKIEHPKIHTYYLNANKKRIG